MFLEISQNSQKNTFIKKETLAQVFSYEFCEISKNIFFTEHLWTTASEIPIKDNTEKHAYKLLIGPNSVGPR